MWNAKNQLGRSSLLITVSCLVSGNLEWYEELETALLEDPTYKRQVERLLYYPTALQTYLRRLGKTRPDRVRHFKSSGKHKWEIHSN